MYEKDGVEFYKHIGTRRYLCLNSQGEGTMFFPTPSVTIPLSRVKTSGSSVTPSTAFFSHECRKTNVS